MRKQSCEMGNEIIEVRTFISHFKAPQICNKDTYSWRHYGAQQSRTPTSKKLYIKGVTSYYFFLCLPVPTSFKWIQTHSELNWGWFNGIRVDLEASTDSTR